MSVFRRGKVVWFKFMFEGREHRASTGQGNKEIAKRKEEEYRKRLINGEDVPKKGSKSITFAHAAADFIESQAHWSDKTRTVHESSMKHLEPFFGDMLLTEITPEAVGKYQSKRKADPGKRGKTTGRTINIEVSLLRLVLNHHDLWSRIRRKVKMLPENEEVGRDLSEDEVKRLLAAARASDSRSLYPAVLVSIHTGVRSKELRLLKWKQVDFLKAKIMVGKSKTKAGTGRGVDLSQTALATLEQWHSHFPHAKPEHYVFPSESYSLVGKPGQYGGDVKLDSVTPTKPVSTWKTAWTTVRRKAGVSCRWHDLRHTFASRVGAGGARDQTLKALLGWASAKMIERYSHVSNADKQTAVAALDQPRFLN